MDLSNDFVARAQRQKIAAAKAIQEAKAKPTVLKEKAPGYETRLVHLVEHHLGQMTEWESQFCYSNIYFVKTLEPSVRSDNSRVASILSQRVKDKVAELEAMYCGTICHALNKAGVPHG